MTDSNSQDTDCCEGTDYAEEGHYLQNSDYCRVIYENMADGLAIAQMIFDSVGRPIDYVILEVNASYERQSGLKREEVLGRRAREFLPAVETEACEYYGTVVRTGVPVSFEQYNKSLGRWFDVQAQSLYDDGKFAVIFSDITERKQTEAALLESETMLRTILENSSDGINMLDVKTGKYVYMSPAQVALTGFTAEEMNSFSAEDGYARMHPDDREISMNQQKATAVGTDEYEDAEYRWMVKSGEYRWFRDRRKLVRNESGEPCFLVGISRDITGRKEAEQAHLENERRALGVVEELRATKDELTREVEVLNALHRLNSNFVINDDLDAIYQELLRTTLTLTGAGLGSLQVYDERTGLLHMILTIGLSQRFLEYFRVMDLDAGICGRACKEKKRTFVSNVREFFKGQPALGVLEREEIISAQSIPLISSSGKTAGVLNIYYTAEKFLDSNEIRITDMLARIAADTIERTKTEEALRESERKALALVRELEEADKNKNHFLSVLSHELRNPLSVIMASLSLLKIADTPEQLSMSRDIISRETGQLCKLVDDLLDITRISQKKIVLKKQPLQLNRLLLNAVDNMKLSFKEKGVHLWVKLSSQPIFIEADQVRITQCVENLLSNGLKFTQKKGSVWLTLEQKKNEACINVRDNGVGIEPEMIGRLFKPFSQADPSPDRLESNTGLGLGLSIVKGLVEVHGGRVSAFSEGIGRGALFTIRLPVMVNGKEPSQD